MTATLEQTQQDLARWLEIARRGEEVVITQGGEPVGKLIGIQRKRAFTAEENARGLREMEEAAQTVDPALWEQRREAWLAQLDGLRAGQKIPPPSAMTIQQILDEDRGD